MPSQSWNDNLLIGVADIDSQHKELVSLIDATAGGMGKEEVATTLNFLDQYVILHFSTEEEHLHKIGYSEIDTHKARHEEFKAMISELKVHVSQNGINTAVVQKIKRGLLSWITEHIGKADTRWASYSCKIQQ